MLFEKLRNRQGLIKENIEMLPFQMLNSINKKDIESHFKNYIEHVGWQQNITYSRDRDIKSRYKFRNNRKGSTSGKPDYIFYNNNQDIIAICDTKSTDAGLDESLEDGKDYVRCLNEDYSLNVRCVIGFNGEKLLIQYYDGDEWENVSIESTVLEQMPSLDFLEYIIESNNEIIEVSETENIDRLLLSNFFKATDEIIRRSSIGSSPTEKFIELSTIIFLKVFSLKGYDKTFIDEESLKYSSIWGAVLDGNVIVTNDKFAKWLNNSYHNIGIDSDYKLI